MYLIKQSLVLLFFFTKSIPSTSGIENVSFKNHHYAFIKLQNKSIYRIKVIKVSNKYGYEIYKNGKLYIHQSTIPAISGNKQFSSKKEAKLVGELMIKKMTKGIMPPSISINELDSLKIKM